MDMEHELQALRKQLAEKSKHYLRLQKEVRLFIWESIGDNCKGVMSTSCGNCE